MNSGKAKEDYFRGKDWTVSRPLNALKKFVSRRTAWCYAFGGCEPHAACLPRHWLTADLPDGSAIVVLDEQRLEMTSVNPTARLLV
ncbi:hypothetical protein ACQR16_29250 [Bradyrhizobium oligotrophicum]|uniref:hypothetical protein n=1 Tax=Bradyrhizobium oligotrophicum TaxID=44255 RepID=UPI003EBA5373